MFTFSLIKKLVLALALSVFVVLLALFVGNAGFMLTIPILVFFLVIGIVKQLLTEKDEKQNPEQFDEQNDNDEDQADESAPDTVSHR